MKEIISSYKMLQDQNQLPRRRVNSQI